MDSSSDEDNEANKTVHERLYRKHRAISKKREEEKKRSDTEIMKNAPTTTANNYLARLKNLYASTSESPRNDRFAKTMSEK